MDIILQRYANREYRLTLQSICCPGKNGGDKYAERQAEKYALAVRDTYVLDRQLKDGIVGASPEEGGCVRSFNEWDARRGIRSLDIIDEFHLTKRSLKKGGWGHLAKPTSFTRNARHRLLEAGAVVDKLCGLNAWEVTCTIPGSTDGAFRVVAENTGWIMNEITREIRRSKCPLWFYVWELQKRGALHLHLLIADPSRDLSSLAETVRQRWWALLQSLCTRTGEDVFAKSRRITWKHTPSAWQSHVAPIQKSVAAYFSKYAGKTASPTSKVKGFRKVYTPSRWWGSSKMVKEEIKKERRKYRLEVSASVGEVILKELQSFLDMPGKLKTYKYRFDLGKSKNGTNLGGGDVCINYYDTQTFNRMQMWEKEVWEYVCMMANADMMTDADMGELHLMDNTQISQMCYADIPLRRYAESVTTAPPLPPHSQPSLTVSSDALQGVLRRQPTLAIRARLLQYLAGGDGEPAPKCLPEYIQGELEFDCYDSCRSY